MVTLNKKEHIKLSNQSLVFEVFGDNEKLTVREILDRVNERLKAQNPDERLSDSTIRRAIDELEDKGFIVTYGRQFNAVLYGKPGASLVDGTKKLIPFAGELKSVEDFLKIVTNKEARPLTRNTAIIGEKAQHAIRRKLAFVVLSAGNPGYADAIKKINEEIHKWTEDLTYALKVLESFLNSPVWYEQYRDQMAYEMRRVQERDPELYQLVVDYISSE